jgi:hypothetical protein
MASNKIDISHVQKFYGSYFHVWKHRLSLIFKQERHLLIVQGIKVEPIAPTIAQITANVAQVLAINAGSIFY